MEIGSSLYPAATYRQLYGWNDESDSSASTNKAADSPVQKKDTAYAQQKIRDEVQKLKVTEQKVIAHEMAHKSAGGKYTGPPHYEYNTGPDGKQYIVGGEVSIDVSEERTPEETMQKMSIVRKAALAPADPSPQDQRVAAEATVKEQNARIEYLKNRYSSGSAAKKITLSVFA